MTHTDLLRALRVLNTFLAFGENGLAAAQRWGRVIEQAQTEHRAITADEWQAVQTAANHADTRLAAAIKADTEH